MKNTNSAPPESVTEASTFDWEGRRERYWRILDWRVFTTPPHPQEDRDVAVHRLRLRGEKEAVERAMQRKKKPPKIKQPGIGKGRRYDHAEIAAMYLEGKTVTEISEILQCSIPTVRTALHGQGVYDPKRDLGRPSENTYDLSQHVKPRLKVCRAGLHDMDKYGKEVLGKFKVDGTPKKNGRYCYACKRINDPKDPRTAADFETVDDSHES